jgi:hypothetical protein
MVGKMSLDLNLEAFEIPKAFREPGSSLFLYIHIYFFLIHIYFFSFSFYFFLFLLFYYSPFEL